MERISEAEGGGADGGDADGILVVAPFEVSAVPLDAVDMSEQQSRADGDGG